MKYIKESIMSQDKEEKDTKTFGKNFPYLYFVGIIFANLGWLVENIARLITKGIIDNRFHFLPLIPIYALIPFAFYIVLKDPDEITFFGKNIFEKSRKAKKVLSNLLALCIFLFFVFFGELIFGNLFDKLFGVQLWNYSNQYFHFTPYTSLISTLGFGGGAFLIFKFIYKPLLQRIKQVNRKVILTVNYTLGVLMVVDMFIMVLLTIINHAPPVHWSIQLF